MTLVLTVILVALIFEYINGFHDTANSIATVVATKVLTPRQAIVLAAMTNLIGALVGTAVAKTVASGLVDTHFVTSQVIVCALLGAIIWDLITWYVGLPTSSSHALIGGLCGAVLAVSHNNWRALVWSLPAPTGHWWEGKGLLYKVIIPMFTSPICGLLVGFIFMAFLYVLLRNWRPVTVNRVFGRLQLLSAAYMGFSHGSNDAQKTMGIIALTLVAATKAGTFDNLPSFLTFLHTPPAATGQQEIATWIKVVCALTMAAGTAAGGWRIIKTMGHKMVKLQPVHGFAAETTAATVLFTAAQMGMPVSTTHAISTSIMGVGAAKRLNALKFTVVERILWAWFLTLPASACVAYGIQWAAEKLGFAT